jgi:PAS domain S-box-containing protein
MTIFDIDPSINKHMFIKRGEEIDNLGSIVFEGIHKRKDGAIFPVEVNITKVKLDRDYGVTVARDITDRKQVEIQITRQSKILNAINKVLRERINCKTEEELGKVCLAVAEELTDSKFGFFGELNQAGLFDTIAISNPGWDKCKLPASEATRSIKGMPIRGIDRSTIREGKSRIVNGDEVSTHPDRIGTPEGHPPLTAFMGVPLKQEGRTIGMIGLGNKESGYDAADQEAVEAISVAIVEALKSKRVEDMLQKSRESLAEAQRTAHLGNWDWNIITNELYWSEEIYRIFGLTPREFVATHKAFLDRVHPDDREFVQKSINEALDERKPYSLDHRIVLPNGEVRIVNEQAEVILDESDKSVQMVGTVQDITVRKKAEEEIRKLNKELEQRVIERTAQLESANKELEAFSYSVSHDLRAPLRAIHGFSGKLFENYFNNLEDEGKRLLNVIRGNTQKMGQLIDDLLAFSRIGRKQIELTKIDMKKLANDVYTELKPTISDREVKVTVNELLISLGDRSMIRQVFVNLLSNAIKFTRTKRTAVLEIGSQSEENFNIYYVKDNGVGFDMQFVNKLFGVFQRLHSTREFEGTGVGLAILQRIINKHGGRVWAEGKKGEGATFYFTLPN